MPRAARHSRTHLLYRRGASEWKFLSTVSSAQRSWHLSHSSRSLAGWGVYGFGPAGGKTTGLGKAVDVGPASVGCELVSEVAPGSPNGASRPGARSTCRNRV